MTKRLNGKKDAAQYPRDPHDFYREPEFCPRQIADALDVGDPADTLIWDPFAGVGNMLDEAKRRGFETVASDIVDRQPRHRFFRSNFLLATRWPGSIAGRRKLSIFCNPPYNSPRGVALAIIQKALDEIPFHRAVFVLPIEFTCGQDRYWSLYSKRPPSHVLFHSQRPSMPPGAAVEDLGADAFKGGMADYATLVFSEGGPYRTEARWLTPDDDDAPPDPIERRIR